MKYIVKNVPDKYAICLDFSMFSKIYGILKILLEEFMETAVFWINSHNSKLVRSLEVFIVQIHKQPMRNRADGNAYMPPRNMVLSTAEVVAVVVGVTLH